MWVFKHRLLYFIAWLWCNFSLLLELLQTLKDKLESVEMEKRKLQQSKKKVEDEFCAYRDNKACESSALHAVIR